MSEFTALCTNLKGPLVAGLGWVGGVTALGSPIGAGSVLNGLTGIALASFAIWRGWPRRPGSLAAVGFRGFATRPTAFTLGASDVAHQISRSETSVGVCCLSSNFFLSPTHAQDLFSIFG